MKTNFTVGDLAFFDSFAGLIPCKVMEIKDEHLTNPAWRGHTSECRIRVKLTTRRGAYKKGETLESDALHVVPRPFIFRKGYSPLIRGGYRWIDFMVLAESNMETGGGNRPDLTENAMPEWAFSATSHP